MSIHARICELQAIASLRDRYREEMQCQITHDSIHTRPGWTMEYLLDIDGVAAGYGSVAVAGPWTGAPTLYEFYKAGFVPCGNRITDDLPPLP